MIKFKIFKGVKLKDIHGLLKKIVINRKRTKCEGKINCNGWRKIRLWGERKSKKKGHRCELRAGVALLQQRN